MFCPKCGTELKEGAKFCHSCGFTMGESQAAQAPQQPTQQPQANPNAQFDINKVSVSQWIFAGIAGFGAICTLLPWVTVDLGFFGSASVGGLNSIFGVICFIGFLGIAALTLFGSLMGLDEKNRTNIISIATYSIAGSCVIDIIRFLSQSGGYARPGFGLILALLAAVALVLINLKVIKLK